MTPAADIKALHQLNDDIDQLAGCSELSPEADICLKLAWWFTEEAIREATGECSNAACEMGPRGLAPRRRCDCCAAYDRLGAKARSFRSRL